MAVAPYPLTGECPRCHQQSAYSETCESCRRQDRKPQGTQPALFDPPPAPVLGQTTLNTDPEENKWQRPLTT